MGKSRKGSEKVGPAKPECPGLKSSQILDLPREVLLEAQYTLQSVDVIPACFCQGERPMAFLFVGALAMGGALTETGAGEVVGGILADFANKLSNPYLIGFVFFIVPFLLTQVMMNRTVMIIFIPIAILACKAMGANPVGVIILVQVACLSSFMTPMATPAVPMHRQRSGLRRASG